ncbi:unnamed protein product [Sympodiomycopsis kandeliae]
MANSWGQCCGWGPTTWKERTYCQIDRYAGDTFTIFGTRRLRQRVPTEWGTIGCTMMMNLEPVVARFH